MSDNSDPITMAMMFNAGLILDLTWLLQTIRAYDLPSEQEFIEELAIRRAQSPALDACAKEAGL